MRISTIAYIFKQGFKNIWRNLRFSLASIATMAACIFLFGVFLSLVMNFNNIVHTAEEGIAVVVYFETGTKQEQIDQIGNDIDKQPGVAEIHYVSADEAWESFKEIYLEGEDESMEGAFKSNDNPLANSARYEVYLDDVEQQDTLVKYIEGLDGVRKVEKSEVAANTLSSFNKLMAYVSLAIVVILLAVAFFLIYNTITMGTACLARWMRAACTAGIVPLPGSAMPIASDKQFIEFAVYIPEHEPQPGHEPHSHSISFSSSIRPALYAPTVSKVLESEISSPS